MSAEFRCERIFINFLSFKTSRRDLSGFRCPQRCHIELCAWREFRHSKALPSSSPDPAAQIFSLNSAVTIFHRRKPTSRWCISCMMNIRLFPGLVPVKHLCRIIFQSVTACRRCDEKLCAIWQNGRHSFDREVDWMRSISFSWNPSLASLSRADLMRCQANIQIIK